MTDQMLTHGCLFGIACRAAAFGALIAALPLAAQAGLSFSADPARAAAFYAVSRPAPATAPDSSSSSLSVHLIRNSAGLEAAQPPPRRYGRAHYSDRSSNSDGSRKYTFVGGFGLTAPIGGTHNYLKPGYRFQVGGGRNFNKTFGLLLQFDFDRFGFQAATLSNLLNIYNAGILAYDDANPGADVTELPQLAGASHDWSFTLDPIVNYYNGDRWGAYAIGGAGFYHKTASFTSPGVVPINTGFGIQDVAANQGIDHYTSNAFGVNGGFGFTFRHSSLSAGRFFVEARYVWTDNQPRPFSETGTTSNPNYYDVFPQNSARTTYIPITFGVRF